MATQLSLFLVVEVLLPSLFSADSDAFRETRLITSSGSTVPGHIHSLVQGKQNNEKLASLPLPLMGSQQRSSIYR